MKRFRFRLLILGVAAVALVTSARLASSAFSEDPLEKEPLVTQVGGNYQTSKGVNFITPEGWYLYTGNFLTDNVFFLTPDNSLKFIEPYGLEKAFRKSHILVSIFDLYIQKEVTETPVPVSVEEFIRWQVGYLGDGRNLEKADISGKSWYRWVTPSGLEYEGDKNLVLAYYLKYSEDKLLRVSLYPVTDSPEESPDYQSFIRLVESASFE